MTTDFVSLMRRSPRKVAARRVMILPFFAVYQLPPHATLCPKHTWQVVIVRKQVRARVTCHATALSCCHHYLVKGSVSQVAVIPRVLHRTETIETRTPRKQPVKLPELTILTSQVAHCCPASPPLPPFFFFFFSQGIVQG